MTLFRFLFAPVLLVVATMIGVPDRAPAPRAAAQVPAQAAPVREDRAPSLRAASAHVAPGHEAPAVAR